MSLTRRSLSRRDRRIYPWKPAYASTAYRTSADRTAQARIKATHLVLSSFPAAVKTAVNPADFSQSSHAATVGLPAGELPVAGAGQANLGFVVDRCYPRRENANVLTMRRAAAESNIEVLYEVDS